MFNSLNASTSSSILRRFDKESKTPDVFTRDEKNILLMVKNGFAFSWGFLNVIIFSISGRYATVMTGNLLILATEVRAWKVEEMLLTLTLIMTYICAGAVYNYISIRLHQNTVVLYLMPLIMSLGVLADFLQYMLNSCSSTEKCSGMNLYFLTPVSILTGLVAAGYCFNHKDGVTTNAMTDHLSVFPTTVIKILFTECADSDHLKEKSRQSVSVILSFFVGVIAGDSARTGIRTQYTQQRFTPLFTSFGIGMAMLCFLHHNYCTKFFDHHLTAEADESGTNDDASVFSTMKRSLHEIAEDSKTWNDEEKQEGDVVDVAEM